MHSFPDRSHTILALRSFAAVLALASTSSAQVFEMETTLDGQQETPPIASNGTGTGTVTVDTAANTITFNVSFSGTNGAPQAAHLHGAADPCEPGGIMIPFPSATSPITGTFTYAEVDEPTIVEGRTYVNIHTSTTSGGEIRGQVINADTYCWGDGTATPCPCANGSLAGRGCENSTGHGAILLVTGNNAAASASNDNEFFGLNMLPGQPALLFMGLNAVNGGAGVAFGDGLRCAGGSVVRLGVVLPDAGGKAHWTPTLPDLAPGDVRRFQGWYRDPGGSPCNTNFNLTNGLGITFL